MFSESCCFVRSKDGATYYTIVGDIRCSGIRTVSFLADDVQGGLRSWRD